MTDIRITDESRNPCPELTGKALVEHANQLFQMYSGDAVTVKTAVPPEPHQMW